jgi:hypothetical protein
MKLALLGLLLVVAMFGASCEFVQYDNDMSSCNVSNSKYEIQIYSSRDSDQTNADVILPGFKRACDDIGAPGAGVTKSRR